MWCGEELGDPSWRLGVWRRRGEAGRGHSGRRVAPGPAQLLPRMSARAGLTPLASAHKGWSGAGHQRAVGSGRGRAGEDAGAGRGATGQVDCPQAGREWPRPRREGEGDGPGLLLLWGKRWVTFREKHTQLRGGTR